MQNIKNCISWKLQIADYNQILHSDKDHQLHFVGVPKTCKTNPKWRTAAILKNRKMTTSLQQFSINCFICMAAQKLD